MYIPFLEQMSLPWGTVSLAKSLETGHFVAIKVAA